MGHDSPWPYFEKKLIFACSNTSAEFWLLPVLEGCIEVDAMETFFDLSSASAPMEDGRCNGFESFVRLLTVSPPGFSRWIPESHRVDYSRMVPIAQRYGSLVPNGSCPGEHRFNDLKDTSSLFRV